MSESTIIKPRPGGRKRDLSPAPANDQAAESTVIFSQPSLKHSKAKIPGLGDNLVVDSASVLLSLVSQIRATPRHGDVPSLRQACIDLVREFETDLRKHGIDGEQIEGARYCICSLIDETVLNTPWGEQSIWSSQSLLSTFHSDTLGGEYFFTLLDRSLAEPHRYRDLLELQYLCLSLGFNGKMRIEPQGLSKLEDYRSRVLRAIEINQPERPKELSWRWRERVLNGEELQGGFPVWVIGSVLGLVLLSIYMVFNYQINEYSNQIYTELNTLAPWQKPVQQGIVAEYGDTRHIAQLLQTEVDRGILAISHQPDRLRLTLRSSELFGSGSAEIKESISPVLAKVARALETSQGRILITGHTDDQPIFTSKYPSNWHLSLARATSVANVLSYSADLHGRLWPEGRGEAEPLVKNSSTSTRAQNRRVEIDILYR
ncbi:type VI secretion system protein TssL, long form [Corallincola spongiicola]|uniref:Type VI secretion system protein TssL n=1 Tax=Corallincola spongiicola TaxID=2520508 RepID=A0ABY1WTM2_9GAMM|nr:type VI secretion system protein TssL, long form [Corallincola spongiicola]TAA48079.1 type VI secretion system protein TssL [Corallincola spongiicola]